LTALHTDCAANQKKSLMAILSKIERQSL